MKHSHPRVTRTLAPAALAVAALVVGISAADTSTPSIAVERTCHWADGLPTDVLRLGSTGSCVKYLQGKLAVTADGIFGQQTYNAVVVTQQHCGLVVDGVVGPRAWDAILNWCRE
ncbi:peptidoglycan-binding protein [Streptomyces sp. NPDC059697]|uniref:peptidoglycan-binding domain-containing protein n=1 Tax=Streptomyces sp. NPDC059697 TaxID=3346912 RepID=UPI0036CF8B22